ncbi:MAG: hypothetical protein SPL98_07420 [Bacteroidales bacterium]|nr:hypothetical protein [Bacteroidales bacterium]MDY6403799.1 hypothetical protein [Bacteroidales bacterium]MDY6424729.1 hypothetical protein [Bacteroidales bacterium]
MRKVSIKQAFAIFMGIVLLANVFIACNEDEDYVQKTKTERKVSPAINSETLYSAKLNMVLTLVSEVSDDTMIVLNKSNTSGIEYNRYYSSRDDLGKPDFWSANRDEFYRWVDEKLADGYTVIIVYDKDEGVYFSWALKD